MRYSKKWKFVDQDITEQDFLDEFDFEYLDEEKPRKKLYIAS